ncbi:MAG: LacI family transcriptional regulator [Defluviitaleaceae bacterium]|nr:LacI family transcriptional regulator [Defluviitaleaceae bacterium]
MSKDVNIYDIAQLAGVSKSTVSRVLNGHSHVSDKTRQRVQQAIKDYTYIPNNSARSLSSASTQTVILMVCGITNPFFSQIIALILEKMRTKGFDVILHSYEPGPTVNDVDRVISICKEKRPKGIILLGGNFEKNHQKLRDIGVPIVMASATIHSDKDRTWFSSITIDDEQEGYRMADYICRHGHRNIAVIGQYALRERGIYKAFEAHGVVGKKANLVSERAYSFYTGYKIAKRLLEEGKHSCFLCLSDVLAIGAIKAVQESGRCVPDNISVFGFDGIENGAFTTPSLTSFVQPIDDIAEKSVTTLLDLINVKAPHKHYVLETTLVEGASFAPIS